jgi:hypothetical protein
MLPAIGVKSMSAPLATLLGQPGTFSAKALLPVQLIPVRVPPVRFVSFIVPSGMELTSVPLLLKLCAFNIIFAGSLLAQFIWVCRAEPMAAEGGGLAVQPNSKNRAKALASNKISFIRIKKITLFLFLIISAALCPCNLAGNFP